MKLLNKSIIFVGGKGGVGKSTTSAALALRSSKEGKKTLLVSTDPAHNLGDIFRVELNGGTTKVMESLFIIEVNSEQETNNYIKKVKQNMSGLVKSSLVEEVHRQIETARVSPGAEEAAIFDRIVSIILEERHQYDTIIFDTAPTGHTIRLLSLPELMGIWIEGMLEKRRNTNENYSKLLNDGEPVEDPIYQVLVERKERFRKVRELLLDSNRTGFVFVLNPERLPILETKKAIRLLDSYQLYVDTLIINKVLPQQELDGFWKKRKAIEEHYLTMIDEEFDNRRLIHIPLLEEDIVSSKQLAHFGSYF